MPGQPVVEQHEEHHHQQRDLAGDDALVHRIRAERGVDGALLHDLDGHGQGARVELNGQQAGLVEVQAGDDAVRADHRLDGRRRDQLTVEEDAERLADELGGDLLEELRAVAVEGEGDLWQPALTLEGDLLLARVPGRRRSAPPCWPLS